MSTKDQGRCLVCDDVSIGVNFGVPTCMPCKAFFRRNAKASTSRELTCEGGGNCIISYRFRRVCHSCRLAKCFRVGMKKSLILTDDVRQARNRLVATNRLKRGKIPQLQCPSWMLSPSLARITTDSSNWLSRNDQTILSNIFNAYENTCGLAKNTILKDFPIIRHTLLHEFINELSPEIEVSISYLKLVPEFNNIALDDRVRLIRNHIGTLIHINQPLIYPMVPVNLVVSWTNLLGLDITKMLLQCHQIIEQYMADAVLLKLLLIVLVFSASNSRNTDAIDMDLICDDPLAIFMLQNKYVDLLWKYLVSRSGSEKTAVKIFNKLIMFVLYAYNVHSQVDNYINNLKTEIKQMKPMMQSMWPNTDEEDHGNDLNVAQDITL